MVKQDTHKIYCDVDGVLSTCHNGTDYTLAEPNYRNIRLVNRLYDAGYEITIYSARGSVTGIDWTELTKKQMDDWGVKYHHITLSKPFFYFLVDDRAVNPHCPECRKTLEGILDDNYNA